MNPNIMYCQDMDTESSDGLDTLAADSAVPALRTAIMQELATGVKATPFSIDIAFQMYLDSLGEMSLNAREEELKHLPLLFPYNSRKNLPN